MIARHPMRAILLLVLLAAVGFLATRGIQHWRCERERAGCRVPELAWMRAELKLDAATSRRVEDLHLAYEAKCAALCERICASGGRLDALARQQRGITPELTAAMAEDEKVRANCRLALLQHLYDTANAMPPEAAARFLELTLPAVLRPDHPSVGSAVAPP